MKIWVLAENWPPRRGGIENYLTHITELLVELGHKVTVVAPQAEIEQKVNIRNVEIIRKRFFWPLIKPAWLPLYTFLWRQTKIDRPDILFCGKGLSEGLIGYYINKYLGIHYIVFTYAMEINVWASRRGTQQKLKRVLAAAVKVVCINDVTGNRLLDIGVSDRQLVKISPGVDKRFFLNVEPSRAAAVTRSLGITGPYILSVGRLIERKGFDTLIEAFSQLDQTRHAALKLVIAGEGPDRKRLEQIVTDNYMQTSVIFLGGIDDNKLPALYKGAELFALTPRDVAGDIEGFGIVYLEAAAQGIPVLASNSGGVAEAVVDGITGKIIPANDPLAGTAAIELLITDAEMRQRLGKAASARVKTQFQWSQRIKNIVGLLESVA